ncbi:MAG: ABC transporter ATP-binding protein [Oscillospiraceae bacterium]
MGVSKCKIRVRNVSKAYETKDKQVQVLKDMSLDVYENEFLVLLGPGQCGKTVFLNILADLEKPDNGTIEFLGKEYHHGEIGFVFQRYALFPWKTVIDNVQMNQRFHGVEKKKREETAKKFIDLVGLQGFEKAYPAQLSGGMKQRVGIARAYASNTDLILMDEPFGALDAQTRYQMQGEILKIWEQEKVTVVFVTNNIEEAVTLGDRIVLMSNKPSRVVKEYVPRMPRPRSNTDVEFLELRNEIAEAMDLAL